jgi:hypothetical protein
VPLIVGSDEEVVERELVSGQIGCPGPCGGVLGPWGHARRRQLRRRDGEVLTLRPRRGRCRRCKKTKVLLPDCCLLRRRDEVETIVTALTHKAEGLGCRRIAAKLGLGEFPSRVRSWLRAFGRRAGELRERFTAHAHELDADLGPVAGGGGRFADAVEAMATAARAYVQRFGPVSVFAAIARMSGGALLSNASGL